MQIAFSTISCPAYTPEQIRAAALEHGYDGVELHILEGKGLTAPVLESRLPELRTLFSPSPGGVPICSITQSGRFSAPSLDERQELERQAARCLELAAELGCPRVKVFGGSMPAEAQAAGPVAEEAVFDYIAEHLRRLARRAEELGVRLMVETHDDFGRTRYLKALLDRVPSPAFGALWDVMHPYRYGDSPETVDAAFGERVFHVQVKDCVRVAPGQDTKHFRCVLMGTGELAGDVCRAIALLARRGYRDWISLDWPKAVYPEIEGPEVALPQTAPVLRRYVAEALADAGR
jgi:sugar phosphate isomerase/epimerase